MSKYTTEVRFICENQAGKTESVGGASVNEIIEAARTKIFDFDFPIYDEAYRSVLETKILKHYYTREIGFETVGLWKMWLDKRLNEIMPYYNQLYKSETLEFNPFYDVNFNIKRDNTGKYDETTSSNGSSQNTRTDNLKETTSGDSLRTDALKEETVTDSRRTDNLHEATTDNNTRTDDLHEATTDNSTRTDNLNEATSSETDTTTNATRTDNLAHEDTTTSNGDHWDEYSDTPQGGLSDLQASKYLTNARHITDSDEEHNNGTNTGTVTNEGTQKVTGTGNTANTGTQTNAGTGSRKNTGTQTNTGAGSKDNTGTQDIAGSGTKDNTGTQDIKTSGEKDNTGTQTNNGTTTGNGTKNYTNTDDYLEHVAGKRSYATYSEMLQKYRETFLNIDMQIIEELSDLFMNIW